LKYRLTGITVGLAAGITTAAATAFAVGAFVFSNHHFQTLLDSAEETALAQGEMIREALDHQMLRNDRTLLSQMIENFGRQASMKSVLLLNRTGQIRYASHPELRGTELSIESPTCQACHVYPPGERASSRVIEAQDGTVLRTVVPIRNREECHQCHDASDGTNGILIVDRDVGELRRSMNRDLRWMLAVAGILTFLLVLAVAGILHVVVLRRLKRFQTTARLIAEGDLKRRVPVLGSDTISWLAREFNTMADSMTGLVTEVGQQRERLETVINSIGDGIVVLDPRRRIIAANTAFLERSGNAREEVLGCACSEVTQGACDPSNCPTLECLNTGHPQLRISERPKRDGSLAWEEVQASPILGSDGQISQVVEVWRDISERRAAEARLAESHRLASLGLLASGFSHELNTPLATVLTSVEGILRESREAGGPSLDRGRIMKNAEIARDQIMRCRGITQHFLRLSRGQSSPGEIVDVEAVLAAVVRLVEPTAREESVQLLLVPLDSDVRVRADEADLQHALVNLLLNGVQACEPGGTVSLGVEAGSSVCIQVTDDGCGCGKENLKRIFEPFFSLRKGGTGLGLFLSLNFVRKWGGDILVKSEVNQGSTFQIVLPLLPTGVNNGGKT
jgi:PAS domain S-box-containing protein